MVKVLMGLKGSGKTKQLIELVNAAVIEEMGDVICVELGKKLTYDINYKARLIDISNFNITNYNMLMGFVNGLYAGNYDISHIFIDNIVKVSGSKDLVEADKFMLWLEDFGRENNVSFTVTISAPIGEAGENIKRFLSE